MPRVLVGFGYFICEPPTDSISPEGYHFSLGHAGQYPLLMGVDLASVGSRGVALASVGSRILYQSVLKKMQFVGIRLKRERERRLKGYD